MQDNDLIDILTQDLKPRRPLLTTPLAFLLWLFVSTFSIAFWLFLHGARGDLVQRLAEPLFYLPLALGLAMSVILAWTSLKDRSPEHRASKILIPICLAIWSLGLLASTWGKGNWGMSFDGKAALACAGTILRFSIVPAILLFYLLRQGAPTHMRLAFASLITAAAVFAAFGLSLACPNEDGLHLLLGHALIIILLAALGAAIGKPALRW